MSKVLVIGVSGFSGSHVPDVLTHKGHEVYIFDLVSQNIYYPIKKY